MYILLGFIIRILTCVSWTDVAWQNMFPSILCCVCFLVMIYWVKALAPSNYFCLVANPLATLWRVVNVKCKSAVHKRTCLLHQQVSESSWVLNALTAIVYITGRSYCVWFQNWMHSAGCGWGSLVISVLKNTKKIISAFSLHHFPHQLNGDGACSVWLQVETVLVGQRRLPGIMEHHSGACFLWQPVTQMDNLSGKANRSRDDKFPSCIYSTGPVS